MDIFKSNLEGMREAAGISQNDMANHLGVSQSQVSRYEKDPDEVSLKIYRAWVSYCGDVSSKQSLAVGIPMKEVEERMALIKAYFDAFPISKDEITLRDLKKQADISEPMELIAAFAQISKKPRLGIFGRYDMGKSRIANDFMGSNNLPASYQPATSITCLIRHMDDKPSWQAENVWIMGPDFDLNLADDEQHCKAHRLISGGYEALSEHGTHKHEGTQTTAEGASAATVYIDSDFLKGCDIIDLPGYGHNRDDDQRTEMAQAIADVMIFVSNISGFMNEADRSYLSQLTQHLPVVETPENKLPPLRNLYIVATRADISGGEHNKILDKAAYNCYDGIGRRLEARGDRAGVSVTRQSFRNRFFTYSVEDAELRNNIEKDLVEFFTKVSPKQKLHDLGALVKKAKSSNSNACRKLIETIENAISKREQAQEDLTVILSQEEKRIETNKKKKKDINNTIDLLERESINECRGKLGELTDVERIESLIKANYDDKKEAKKLAPARIIEGIQESVNDILTEKSHRLSDEIDAFLESYDVNFSDAETLRSQWSFNAKGAFISSLTGLGTFGALAAWASITAAGSNLGAYILIGKVVSVLSSLGISLGGTGTVFYVISALGGPITVGIGIAVTVGILAGTLLGDSWQRKLAKQINKGLKKENAEGKIIIQLRDFWADTKSAFEFAVVETEKDYQEKLEALKDIAFNTDVKVLEARLPFLVQLRDFFAGIPWKPSS